MDEKKKVNWPQAAMLATIVLGTVAALIGVPLETWQGLPYEAIGGLVTVVVAALASTSMGPLLRSSTDEKKKKLDAKEKPNRESGYADTWALWALLWMVAFAVATWSAIRSGVLPLTLAVLAMGCSASSLRTHRMALGLTDIALGGGAEVLSSVGAEAVASCGDDEECMQRSKGAIADAEAAFTLADAARGAYSTAIDVAREVGEGDFLTAVGLGARGLLRAYYFVRAALCRLGREIPEPPRLLVQAVVWASREELGDVPECVLAVR